MQTENEGYVITSDVSSLVNVNCDEIWLITRAGKDIPGTIRVRALAPEKTLFAQYYREWRLKDPKEWWPLYRQEFLRELAMPEKMYALRKLWQLVKRGKIIALACFCKDSRYCHRTLVGNILKEHGIRVYEIGKNEVTNHEYRQLNLF